MLRPIRALAPLAVLTALSTQSVVAQDVEQSLASIRGVLEAREATGMSGVILIRAANEVLLHEAYGSRDQEADDPMATAVGFDIGSLVKPITATVVLRLEELGRLSTDDRLADFFPDAPPDKADITVWELLTHTAGLPDIFGPDYDVVSRDWVLDQALSAELLSAPGEEESYSNAGYSLLAMIVEDVTGVPFEEAVRQLSFGPAETLDLGYVSAGWTTTEMAVGYRDGQRWGTPLDQEWADDGPSWNLRGNGGMLGTAEAMSRWYEALFDGKLLGPEALDKYYDFDVGESLSVGGRAMAHAGGNGIFNTLQVSFIGRDVHMTIFTSTWPNNAEDVWGDISEHVISIARATPPPSY